MVSRRVTLSATAGITVGAGVRARVLSVDSGQIRLSTQPQHGGLITGLAPPDPPPPELLKDLEDSSVPESLKSTDFKINQQV